MIPRLDASHFLQAAADWTEPWGLAIGGTTQVLAEHVTLAGDSRTRRTGLLGREALPHGQALVLAPCQGIHTFGMRFPIDVVCVARDGRVVKIADAVAPRRIVFSWQAFAIVEMAAGRCREVGLAKGVLLRAQRSSQTGVK